MEIDGFTFVAQLINFFVLLAVLNKFFYPRLKAVLEAREQQINTRMQEYETLKKSAQAQIDLNQQASAAFARQSEAMLEKSRQEAQREGELILGKVREEAQQSEQLWHQRLQQQQQAFFLNLRSRISQFVLAVSHHVLKDLADAPLEALISQKFVAQFKALPPDQLQQLSAAFSKAGPVMITSGFELPEKDSQELQLLLNRDLNYQGLIQFKTEQGLVGVALQVDSYRLSWNLDVYLEDLEATLRPQLKVEHDAS